MTFGEASKQYLAAVAHSLKPGSFSTEISCVNRLCNEFGDALTTNINAGVIMAYRNTRIEAGVSPSTINQEVDVARKVLKHAGFYEPFNLVRKLKVPKPHRRLLTAEEVERLCLESSDINYSLGLFVRFLSYTGAREQEATRVTVGDFDRVKRTVCIGSDGKAKNGRHRFVECSDSLYGFMVGLCDGLGYGYSLFRFDTQKYHRYLFEVARKEAGLEWVGFHDLRHYFASQCVMSGIDFHTIAKWLGHSDSSLLAKRYAHLSDEHAKKQASRLKFQ